MESCENYEKIMFCCDRFHERENSALQHTRINDLHRRTGHEGSEVEGVQVYLYSFFNLGARSDV
jgi:hypothetical protein